MSLDIVFFYSLIIKRTGSTVNSLFIVSFQVAYFFLLFNYVYVCQGMCLRVQVFKEAKGVRFPEARVTGYEPHEVGAET